MDNGTHFSLSSINNTRSVKSLSRLLVYDTNVACNCYDTQICGRMNMKLQWLRAGDPAVQCGKGVSDVCKTLHQICSIDSEKARRHRCFNGADMPDVGRAEMEPARTMKPGRFSLSAIEK